MFWVKQKEVITSTRKASWYNQGHHHSKQKKSLAWCTSKYRLFGSCCLYLLRVDDATERVGKSTTYGEPCLVDFLTGLPKDIDKERLLVRRGCGY